jgi:cbb3-type cytochrome oxidase maturation protein
MSGTYLVFLLYLLAGIVLCAAVFYWAVASGQFRDQERARYLPLFGQAPLPRDVSTGRWSRSMILTVLLLCGTLAVQIAVVLILASSRGRIS